MSVLGLLRRPVGRVTLPLRGLSEFYVRPIKNGDPPHAGRSWDASDLRRKSFEDLHKLWFVLYKERNALLSELTRVKRVKNKPRIETEMLKMHKVRKSMGGIKTVLAERRKAYKDARLDDALRNRNI
mmetsp:Transcript_58359/g.79556  ORF Transcript_58359/g.79556 Transcript_58359/m.79556 type:complete len:127 (-) Transcript_58359:385-765(-)